MYIFQAILAVKSLYNLNLANLTSAITEKISSYQIAT